MHRAITNTTLLIDGPDEVELTPGNITYTLFEFSSLPPVTCDCGMCEPRCKTHWSFKGAFINSSDSDTLELQALTRDSAGQYICTCLNPSTSKSERKQFNVHVLCKFINYILIYKTHRLRWKSLKI